MILYLIVKFTLLFDKLTEVEPIRDHIKHVRPISLDDLKICIPSLVSKYLGFG